MADYVKMDFSQVEKASYLLNILERSELTDDEISEVLDICEGITKRITTMANSLGTAIQKLPREVLDEKIPRGYMVREQVEMLAYIGSGWLADDARAIKEERERGATTDRNRDK